MTEHWVHSEGANSPHNEFLLESGIADGISNDLRATHRILETEDQGAEPIDQVFARILENVYQLSRIRQGLPHDEETEAMEKQRIAAELWCTLYSSPSSPASNVARRIIMPISHVQGELPPPTRFVRRQRRSTQSVFQQVG